MAKPRPLAGFVAGAFAGIIASAAMAFFQVKASPLVDAGGDPADSTTARAADKAVSAATDKHLPKAYRAAGGHLVHYAVGAVLGGVYGVVTEYRPDASAGFGTAYGIATAALLDEAAVPALGLSEPVDETPLAVHAYGLASHLVYGVVLEGARVMLVGRR
ncbi:DUF1440 domain-containing protein [Sphingomonas cannabina]|uniref:DUF1440 domain-containing protein n=1 Tax=Sphingomonas cannabina TaxID=2899123 RepID=UPI001F1745FD|nr:DUF1440 domain-containing protein [Sphingomonas cannabina]UIJ45213.1 DUF1440 domain-containing protein [Sphingomonas cannabina]